VRSEIIKIAVWGIVVLLFQIGTSSLFEIRGIRPDFMLIWTIIVTVKYNRYFGLAAGFFAGLGQDALMIGFMGVQTLTKNSIAFWFGVWLDRKEGKLSAIGWTVVFLLILLHESFTSIFYLQGSSVSFGSNFISTVIPTTLYTGTVGFLWGLSPFNTGRKSIAGVLKTSQQRRVK